MTKIVVITGANRGIGLALAKAMDGLGVKIIGTARRPEEATELKALANCIDVVQAEMADISSLPRVAEDIAKLAPDGIDELWNNAGQMQNSQPMEKIDPFGFQTELTVNVVAPSELTRHLLPLLRQKLTKKIIFMTSAMGSSTNAARFIGASLKGLNPVVTEDYFIQIPYSTTKSALTMQAIGWNGALFKEGFATIAIHPGWVQTDMTGGSGRAALTTEQSVAGLLKTVGDFVPSEDFVTLNYNGNIIPW